MVSKKKTKRKNYASANSARITHQAIAAKKHIHPVVDKVLAIKEYNDSVTGAPRFTVRLLEYAQDKQDCPIGCTDLRTFNSMEEAVEFIKSR